MTYFEVIQDTAEANTTNSTFVLRKDSAPLQPSLDLSKTKIIDYVIVQAIS